MREGFRRDLEGRLMNQKQSIGKLERVGPHGGVSSRIIPEEELERE